MKKKTAAAVAARAKYNWPDCGPKSWWWFETGNRQHVHEFSAAWEILRRSRAFRQLDSARNRLAAQFPAIRENTSNGFMQRLKFQRQLDAMLPKSPPARRELREMIGRWQYMLSHGWTPEKPYPEASAGETYQGILPDGKVVRIPTTTGDRNHGIPVIIPRQVASRGHIRVFVELCAVALEPSKPSFAIHRAGSTAPTEMLSRMQDLGKPLAITGQGEFIAIRFPLHHPVNAIEALLKSGLDQIEKGKAWMKPADHLNPYSRGPQMLAGTLIPLEAIALFPANQPRNVIESGFRTLIRPERVEKLLPKFREEWIKWDSSERAKYSSGKSPVEFENDSRAEWEDALCDGRLDPQSTTHPIRPDKDLDNLACADCAANYKRNRSKLPPALPVRLRDDSDLNKRIETGQRLVSSVDSVFLPLLNPSDFSSA